ncbi:MlaD family protein [Aureimonas frigidaquae]|uniref:MlaD family protein n=1 Tax=Aureimonas frigidaquae TaxID=424757 RepID=UPI0007828D88|nr:MlaD family protein [Aureimonas frigidaquae]
MENRANYILVGVFTLAILALSFGFIYWSANVSDANKRVPLIVRIEGSVSGLSVGSQVLFNGLAVGAVTNLRIDPNNPRVVIATTQVDRTTPITTSTAATLGSQGLTGVSFIGLTGGNVNDRNIIESAMAEGATPVIRASPSDVTDILATARDISERANNILGEFERLVQEIGPAVRTTANNIAATSDHVEVFTASLAQNADQIPDFVASLGRLAESANSVALRLPTLIDRASEFITALNVESVNSSIENVAAITQSVRDQTGNITATVEQVATAARSFGAVGETINRNLSSVDQFVANLGPISEQAQSVAGRLDTTLQSAEGLVASIDPAQVRATLDGVRGFADALNAQSGALGSIFGGTQTVLSSLATALNGLNGTRAQIDEIIAGIDADDVTQVMNNISAASANIASAADSVGGVARDIGNRREDIDRIITNAEDISTNLRSASVQVQTILDSVNGLVNSPDGQGLTAEARATLQSIRQTADIVRANIGPIAANLQSFSGQGLNDVRSLIREASGAISRIERAIIGLADNPSRIIYGGTGSGQVREFDGRTRR